MINSNTRQKNQIVDLILLLFIHVLLFLALVAVSIWLLYHFVFSNAYFNFIIVNDSKTVPIEQTVDDPGVIDEVEVDESQEMMPFVAYGTQWATLNIDGWEYKDIPVYYGDSDNYLSMGAGLWFGSRFCGQGGKIVISAHVTSHFYEIEDTEIGTEIKINTTYGPYTYKVTDIIIFDYNDGSPLSPDDSKEQLLLYTCYPRENGFAFKEKRIGLLCEKVSGKDYATMASLIEDEENE